MVTKQTKRIENMPCEQLEAEMRAFAKRRTKSVKSARRFLRVVGMNIKTDGTVVISKPQD